MPIAPKVIARATVTLQLGRGADLAWLPQEAILFDGSALRRQTRVEMAGDARFLGIGAGVPGRAAVGETVARRVLEDSRTVRCGGKLLLVDPFRLDDGVLARTSDAALLGGARAFSTLILAGPGTAVARTLASAAGAGLGFEYVMMIEPGGITVT